MCMYKYQLQNALSTQYTYLRIAGEYFYSMYGNKLSVWYVLLCRVGTKVQCMCTYVCMYITVSACVPLCVAQSAATKAIVEAQLIRRLSQRPTKGELQDRNILKG